MSNYYNKEIETAPREYLDAIQSMRLIRMVYNCYENVPFYKKKFDEIGLLPQDIKSIADIVKLPFTVKQDLRDNYPFLRLLSRIKWLNSPYHGCNAHRSTCSDRHAPRLSQRRRSLRAGTPLACGRGHDLHRQDPCGLAG